MTYHRMGNGILMYTIKKYVENNKKIIAKIQLI